MRVSAIPYTHGQLPSLPAPAAPDGDVRHPDAVSSRLTGGRPTTVRKLAQSGNRGEYRPANQTVTGVTRHDAEPASGTLARVPIVFVPDRKRTDDAQPRYLGKDRRSFGSWSESLLRPGDERGDGAGGSVHSGATSIPATTGLGAVAGHPEEAPGDQRAREHQS